MFNLFLKCEEIKCNEYVKKWEIAQAASTPRSCCESSWYLPYVSMLVSFVAGRSSTPPTGVTSANRIYQCLAGNNLITHLFCDLLPD